MPLGNKGGKLLFPQAKGILILIIPAKPLNDAQMGGFSSFKSTE